MVDVNQVHQLDSWLPNPCVQTSKLKTFQTRIHHIQVIRAIFYPLKQSVWICFMSLHLFWHYSWPNHFQPRQDLPSSFAYKRNINTPYSTFIPYLLGKGFKMKWENVNKGKIAYRRWQHLKGQLLESMIEDQPQQNVSFSLRMVSNKPRMEAPGFLKPKDGNSPLSGCQRPSEPLLSWRTPPQTDRLPAEPARFFCQCAALF